MNPRLSVILVCLHFSGCDSPGNRTGNAGDGKEPAEFQSGGFVRSAGARTGSARGDGEDPVMTGASAPAWFSSEGRPTIELPTESKEAFAFGDLHLTEGTAEWRGFEVDLDRDGENEVIVRDKRKGKIPRHRIIRKFDGEWEWIGWLDGEFSLFRQTEGWMDDIVATVPKGKSGGKTITTMKFNGLRYREIMKSEEDGRDRRVFRLSPDPVVPPPGEAAGWVSPLVGAWADMIHMGREGPVCITTVSINPDGCYHAVWIGIVPSEESRKDGAPYEPVGADLERHETGRIDLRTGREILPPGRRSVTMRSIHWEVIDGKLHWKMDMGTMGGQGVTYNPVD